MPIKKSYELNNARGLIKKLKENPVIIETNEHINEGRRFERDFNRGKYNV